MEIPVMGVSYMGNTNIQNMEEPDIEYLNTYTPNINDLTTEDLSKCFDLEEIELARLKSKFEHYAIIKWKKNYEQDCVEFLHDYLLMFMKNFLRHMAQQSRVFKIDCPLLTRAKKIEPPDKSKTEKPWEMKVMWNKLTPKKIEVMKKNDEKEKIMKKSISWGTGLRLKKSILDYKLTDLLNTEAMQNKEKAKKNTENPFLDNQRLLGTSPYRITTIQVPSSLPGPSGYRLKKLNRRKGKEDGEKNKKNKTRIKDAVKYEVVPINFQVEDFLELIQYGCPLIPNKVVEARLEYAALMIKAKPSFWKQEQTVEEEKEKEEDDGIEVVTLD